MVACHDGDAARGQGALTHGGDGDVAGAATQHGEEEEGHQRCTRRRGNEVEPRASLGEKKKTVLQAQAGQRPRCFAGHGVALAGAAGRIGGGRRCRHGAALRGKASKS